MALQNPSKASKFNHIIIYIKIFILFIFIHSLMREDDKNVRLRRLRSGKKVQNLEAKKSALLYLKSRNFSET